MHEILTTTRANLTERAAELEALIAEGEQKTQAIADEGNRQVTAIKDKALAEIDAIREAMAKHTVELAGVQHSVGTIDAIAAATRLPAVHIDRPMTQEEADAAMRRYQQEIDARCEADALAVSTDGSNAVVTTLTEKKKP